MEVEAGLSVEIRAVAARRSGPGAGGDEASLVRYADNRNVSRNLRDRFPFPYTAADAREWIAPPARRRR